MRTRIPDVFTALSAHEQNFLLWLYDRSQPKKDYSGFHWRQALHKFFDSPWCYEKTTPEGGGRIELTRWGRRKITEYLQAQPGGEPLLNPPVTVRVIYLPAINKHVTLGQYVTAVIKAKENPNGLFKHGLTTWWEVRGSTIRREFLAGVHDRINRHLPGFGRGKKWQEPYQTELRRDADFLARIRTTRIPRLSTPELWRRFRPLWEQYHEEG